jgi:hypothetical protein
MAITLYDRWFADPSSVVGVVYLDDCGLISIIDYADGDCIDGYYVDNGEVCTFDISKVDNLYDELTAAREVSRAHWDLIML